MKIKNTTDKTTAKVIGIGRYWLQPGEEKDIPDKLLYTKELDDFGRETGRMVLLKSLRQQKAALEVQLKELEVAKEDNAEGDIDEPDPATDNSDADLEAARKAEIAAKRAATRAANKAAKEAAAQA